MLKKYLQISLFIFLTLQFLGCEVETSWTFEDIETNLLVVTGIITNEKKAHEIILTKPSDELNQSNEGVSNALVYISDGDTTYKLTENMLKPGTYITDSNFRAVVNRIYTLVIIKDDRQYGSSASMLPVTPFNRLKLRYDESRLMFSIDSVTQAFDNEESAMYEINIDWTNVPGYEMIPTKDKVARMYYYSLSTVDISEVFSPEKEEIYFPAGTKIIEKKYSLSPAHASFIRSMLLETEWRGGLFDVAQGNVYSNLSHGAIGFFGACTVIEDRFIAE